MDRNPTADMDPVPWDSSSKGYAISGKIMLTAMVILFAVVFLLVGFHLYVRWYLLPSRRRHLRPFSGRRGPGNNIVFYVDNPDSAAITSSNRGLDVAVLSSLPLFIYSSKTHPEILECAVCLSEFEDNEGGRLLPKCNHSFHIECIDMWFHSHSTCPICRTAVEPVESNRNGRSNLEVSGGQVVELEPCSSSGPVSTCQHEEHSCSASLAARRKGSEMVGVRIEVPRRDESMDELVLSSPASRGLKSPGGTRLLSLRRLLSLNRRSSGSGTGGESVPAGSELDLERGFGELTQRQTREHTPR